MIICYLSLATWVPISCVMSRRGGAVKNRADLYFSMIFQQDAARPCSSFDRSLSLAALCQRLYYTVHVKINVVSIE